MATVRRDYYEVLGVSRDATDADLKSAFRNLARELHPDVSEDSGAEEKFREVAEAYEVLSKAETRQLYDRFGHDGLQSGGFRPRHADFGNLSDLIGSFFGGDVFGDLFGATAGRPRRGADAAVQVELDLAEAAAGQRREVCYSIAQTCEGCSGNCAEPGTPLEPCPTCDGAGRLQAVSASVIGQIVRTQACPRCSGSGRIVVTPCSTCGGEGRVRAEKRVEVDIPAGIHDGQRIRLGGLGHVEGAVPRAGDLFVHVHVREDPRFLRDGDDLVSRVDLSMAQAALGGTIAIPTLEGETEVDLNPGTQPGEVLSLRGMGMPVLQGRGRGDQRVIVNVRVPRRLTPEQRELLEQLDTSIDDASYDEDDGFFDRLKAAFR